jgi:hypothetical protein
MSWIWRTRGDGLIEVDRGTGKGYGVPILDQFDVGIGKQIARTGQWKPLVQEIAGARGVSLPWCLGVIFAESAGDPRAESTIYDAAGNPHPGARGLMQVMPFVGKAYGVPNPDDLFIPGVCVDVGSRILAEYAGKGFDIPQCASMYNAGPSETTGGPKLSTKSPWGMVENDGYILRVVAAHNFFLKALGYSGSAPPTRSGGGLGLPVILIAGYFLLKGTKGKRAA